MVSRKYDNLCNPSKNMNADLNPEKLLKTKVMHHSNTYKMTPKRTFYLQK